MTCSSEARDTSSAGLGGMGPAISRSRLLLTSEGMISPLMSFQSGASRVNRLVIPLWWLLIWNSSARRGLRISKPTRTTFLPNSAKLTARLAATKVLPSPEVEEVNISTFSPGCSINCTLVRMERNISSIWLFVFSCTTMSARPLALSLATGMSAMMGRLVNAVTSS